MLFGGPGNDLFFAIQPQLLGGSNTDIDHFDGARVSTPSARCCGSTRGTPAERSTSPLILPGQSFAFKV